VNNQGSNTELSDTSKAFLLKEAEDIRTMHFELIKGLGNTEKLALIGTSGIWTWWFSSDDKLFEVLIVLIVFQIALGLKALGIRLVMKSNRSYLQTIERSLALPDKLGWGRNTANRSRLVRAVSGHLFWLLLFGTTLLGLGRFWP
jgi:hypothetical protein